MIGLDTNVLVRYLTRDDAEQYRRAKTFLESRCTEARPGYVNLVVLSELAWVLKAAYGATREEIARVLEQLLVTKQIKVGHRDAVQAALQAYKTSMADFADCLIGSLNQEARCTGTATFDQWASELDGFEAV
ncbi:MAG: PIN domain-containing protein [Bacteroidetes bacterium]|jgi:predicted nucleic-acid-binding protein|nr:PIN domain-containing protein [Bacteroidota bacterium]